MVPEQVNNPQVIESIKCSVMKAEQQGSVALSLDSVESESP